MTAVKICGLTRPQDVSLACSLGAAALGFNFALESPRRVTPEAARRLSDAASPGVLRVGVFVSEDADVIRQAVEAVRLDLIQIHRPLRAEDLDRPPVPVVAVARVGQGGTEVPEESLLSRCRALLFDTVGPERAGGTGRIFDWAFISGRDFGLPIVVAGGLTPENVAVAVARLRPWAVDVASGVESEPGVKDPEAMRRFFDAVRRADAGQD